MRPIQVVTTLEDLVNSSQGTFTREGVILSDHDNQTVKEMYQQWFLLLIDLGYLAPECLKRDFTRLWIDIQQADVLFVLKTFAELSHQIRLGQAKGFKALCSSISLHLYSFFREDVTRLSRGDIFAGKRLLQAFAYCNRLSLQDIDLSQQCIEDYLHVENEIDATWLPTGLTSSLNKIVKRWFRYWKLESLPTHGPGGVMGHGRCSLDTKYRDLSSDQLLEYVFGDSIELPHFQEQRSTMDRITQTIFVPKSYKTFRTISMESSTTMFYQQAVWKSIDSYVNKHSFLRARIGFHDQERNQQLARIGSMDRNYATIDLSAASDSVSYSLTKAVFRGTPLYRYIVGTRSSRTMLPDGRVISLKKFAPMGSALCFPIETIIFAAICHHVTREHGAFGDYSVFGDDIIVPTNTYDDIVYCLTVLGFHVNASKSFADPNCWFRESCGGEYMDGYDVTPMMLGRNFASSIVDVRAQQLVDMANTAGEKNYSYLRSFIVRKLKAVEITSNASSRRKKEKRIKRMFIPFYSPQSLVSRSYSNFHTKRRWSPTLHRIEVLISSTQIKYKTRIEEVAYYHWLRSTLNREEVIDAFVSNTGGQSVSIRDKYVGKPYDHLDDDFIWFFTQHLVSRKLLRDLEPSKG